jgi:hypothetical protein
MRRERTTGALERMLDAEARLASDTTGEGWLAWQRAGVAYWLEQHPEDAALRKPERGAVPSIERMRALADAITRTNAGIPSMWRFRPTARLRADPMARVAWFHELGRLLYAPLWVALANVQGGDPTELELPIRFLEADLYCDRSGYVAADVIGVIVRTPERVRYDERLRAIVLARVDARARREFRAFIRLARAIDDPVLRERLTVRIDGVDRLAARQARWMLDGMDHGGPRPPERS